MPEAQLGEVRLEFDRCVIFGEVDALGRLALNLCGYDAMGYEDRANADRLVRTLRRKQGAVVGSPRACADCEACTAGCFVLTRRPLSSRLSSLVSAMKEVMNTAAVGAELTFQCAGKICIFSTRSTYIGDTWAYFVKDPSEEMLTAIQSIPGVVRVWLESIECPIRATHVMTILVSSNAKTSLEDCLAAVTNVLVAS